MREAGSPWLHQIWLAATRGAAIKAFDHFLEKYGAKVKGA